MDRIAVIDCGTNTFHLLIAERKNGRLKKLFRTKAVVKLGEGGINNGVILDVPFRRGIDALKEFRKQIDEWEAGEVHAFGTAALRNASNCRDFINTAKRESNITPEVISGNREAVLIYKGVLSSGSLNDETSLVMDIGGGSTEFIICNSEEIFWKHSFKAGAALMLEIFNPSDPLKQSEKKKMEAWMQELFNPLLEAAQTYNPVQLIGSSGSFDTFAEMILYNINGDLSELKGRSSWEFNMSEYKKLQKVILQSTTAERMNMKGLVKMRVDMIVMGTVQLNFVLAGTGIKKMILSRYALKEGILQELTAQKK